MEKIVISNWVRKPQGRKMIQVVYLSKGTRGRKTSATRHELVKD